jgi:GNAT superfamily N-acetyltransferase
MPKKSPKKPPGWPRKNKTSTGAVKLMNIRRAKLSDCQALAEFNINMAKETEGIELIPKVIAAGVEAMIKNPQMGFYLVVEDEGDIQASLMVTTEWSDWRNGLFWWIQSVYVTEAYRRRGLYRKLYERVKGLAEAEEHVCGFRLYVEHDNRVAQKAYQSLGMDETDYKLYEELKPGTKYRSN